MRKGLSVESSPKRDPWWEANNSEKNEKTVYRGKKDAEKTFRESRVRAVALKSLDPGKKGKRRRAGNSEGTNFLRKKRCTSPPMDKLQGKVVIGNNITKEKALRRKKIHYTSKP